MRIHIDAKLKFDVNTSKFLVQRNLETCGKVQQYIDSACLRLMTPYVPFRTGKLMESGTVHTKIGSGVIKYAPKSQGQSKSYAARLYYNPQFNFNQSYHPLAGAYWFERMKKAKKNEILEGAKKIAGAR